MAALLLSILLEFDFVKDSFFFFKKEGFSSSLVTWSISESNFQFKENILPFFLTKSSWLPKFTLLTTQPFDLRHFAIFCLKQVYILGKVDQFLLDAIGNILRKIFLLTLNRTYPFIYFINIGAIFHIQFFILNFLLLSLIIMLLVHCAILSDLLEFNLQLI